MVPQSPCVHQWSHRMTLGMSHPLEMHNLCEQVISIHMQKNNHMPMTSISKILQQ